MKSVSDLRSNFCRQVKCFIELDSVIKNKGFLWVPFVHLPNWQQYISKVEEKYMFGLL
jgi:hypothetical protein